ncbi:MAG: lipase family alpha/beta hydrolase [Gammaproteobacteria bacterium]
MAAQPTRLFPRIRLAHASHRGLPLRTAAPLLAALALLASCTSVHEIRPDPRNECVILLHGLNRTPASMEKIAASLEDSGYRVANVGYPSREYPIEKLAPLAVDKGLSACRSQLDRGTIHLVTHSLGGILVRQYLSAHEIERLGRVVMLAPPNQGSHAVDVWRGVPGFDWVTGQATHQLGKGEESVPLKLGPPDFELGIIAGDRTFNPIISAVLENPDDGKVTVDDTRLDGMADFRVVPASHAFIMRKDEVIRLIKAFLASGSFGAGD